MLSLALILLISPVSEGQEIKLTVNGQARFHNNDFTINDAGEDFNSNITSTSNLFLTVWSENFWDKGNNPNPGWRIEVNKTDIDWIDEIELQIKRTGNGRNVGKKYAGQSTIQGGDNFQTVTNSPLNFLNGTGQIGFIPIQFRLSGVSVVHGARDFETNIVFTIYDD